MIYMPVKQYQFKGYIDDDARLIYEMLVKFWPKKGPLQEKAIFFYNEIDDPQAFDFKTGEIAIRIYADNIISEPKGISYDSESASRTINIDIRGLDRDDTRYCADQIRYILAMNRLRPGNDWQTLQFSAYQPIYPSFKFFHTVVSCTLRKYYTMLPNVDLNGVVNYDVDSS